MTKSEKKHIIRWYILPFLFCSYSVALLAGISIFRGLYAGEFALVPIVLWFLMKKLEGIVYSMTLEYGVITQEDIDDVR